VVYIYKSSAPVGESCEKNQAFFLYACVTFQEESGIHTCRVVHSHDIRFYAILFHFPSFTRFDFLCNQHPHAFPNTLRDFHGNIHIHENQYLHNNSITNDDTHSHYFAYTHHNSDTND
jgi:hypothetical protein